MDRQRRILPGAGNADDAARGSLRLRGGRSAFVPPAGQHVIVLDVDGTLYGAESGIEQQIVANIHRFALSCCELTPDECDELHRRHGSTIAGLKSEKKISKDLEDRFYREVYGTIDYSQLLGAAAEGDASGYKHICSVRELLLRSGVRVAIASNSPSWHVHRVLCALGLSRVPWCAILTPDLVGGFTKSDPLFWSPILEKYHPRREGGELLFTQSGHFHIDLLDDSERNLAVAQLLGIHGTRVEPDKGFRVEHALLTVLGVLPRRDDWVFDSRKYLEAKNHCDALALSSAVKTRLEQELKTMDTGGGPLRIVDVGAGLLPFLPYFTKVVVGDGDLCGTHAALHYVALETEESLFEHNCQALLAAGYTVCSPTTTSDNYTPPAPPPPPSSDPLPLHRHKGTDPEASPGQADQTQKQEKEKKQDMMTFTRWRTPAGSGSEGGGGGGRGGGGVTVTLVRKDFRRLQAKTHPTCC
jgi:FMN phosphatase YigB (HAD superfamily)